MTISGWNKKYNEIVNEFNYSRKKDEEAAMILNSHLNKFQLNRIKQIIHNKVVFVIGAGPSLVSSIPILKKFNVTKIVADGATKPLLENNIMPDIIVTDLDGIYEYTERISNNDTIIVVHAHGDNINKLKISTVFKNCIGTTETKELTNVYNFGGFTDGDRCVFLANHFHAKKIILFGMDFGNIIGKYSKNKIINKSLKIKKLKKAKELLEWLASKGKNEWYTTSNNIKGFKKINYHDIKKICMY